MCRISTFFPEDLNWKPSIPSTTQLIKNVQKVALPLILLVGLTNTQQAEAGFGFFTACMALCMGSTAGAFTPACVAACSLSLAAPTP